LTYKVEKLSREIR